MKKVQNYFENVDNWGNVFNHMNQDGTINEEGGIRLAEAMAYQVDPLNNPNDSFYFVLWCKAHHWGWDWNRTRDKSYTVYRLPKSILWSKLICSGLPKVNLLKFAISSAIA